jgi:molecular chaperone HscB
MNYFKFFQLPVSFFPDEAELKKRFLQNSKRFHPDFFTLEPPEKQAEILELSTFNNQAFQTLSDFDKRVKYILNLEGVLKEEGENEISPHFLMEMMEINEVLMELEFDFDKAVWEKIKNQVHQLEQELFNSVKPLMEKYRLSSTVPEDLEAIKDFFLKRKYLWRINGNLDKFAPASKEV